jgi:hypothetical protein
MAQASKVPIMNGFLLTCLGVALLVPGSVGCGKKESPLKADLVHGQSARPINDPGEPARGEPAQADNKEGPAKDAKSNTLARKIKYTAAIQLITEEFARAEAEVKKLVKQAGGYVANSEITASPGSIKTGIWKARIPVKEFDSFREAVLKLGEVEKNTVDSQDLTEEYYDLESTIKNRQAEEEALRKLMDKASDKLESFFAIRRELNQVHEDIDRKLGRLKLLADLTDMTSVSLTIRQKQKYVAEQGPAAAEKPTFGMRLGKTLGDSTATLVGLLQDVVVVATALLPWSPFILAGVILAWVLVQRGRQASAAIKTEPPAQTQ